MPKFLTSREGGGRNLYRVKNKEILDYIAQREWNTYIFLYCYFEKVFTDSGFWHRFLEYKEKQNEDSFEELKEHYACFIKKYTKINGEKEIRRIFPKILNVFAVENKLRGSEQGRISKDRFRFPDLMYNRENWRDLDKDKGITRRQARERAVVNNDRQQDYDNYYIEKASRTIKKIQPESEVRDEWWSAAVATQIHHIFPKSSFPEIAHYVENLIALTPTQHLSKAHPDGHTTKIDKDYQLTCLLNKVDTINTSSASFGEKYYRKESFIKVCQRGLSVNELNQTPWRDIKKRLRQIYNEAHP